MSISSVSGIGSGWEQMQRQAMQQTMFKQMDQNGDGSVTKSDLQTLAQNISQTTGASINVDQVFSALDTNNDGTISQSEYDSAMQQFQSGGQQGQIHGHHHHHHHGAQQAGGSDGSSDPLQALFQQMDQDGDGKISQSEFQTGMQNLTQGNGDATGLSNLFATLDTNGDGVIDQAEQAEQAAAPQALANASQAPPLPPPVQGSADLAQALFQQLDTDGDGEISQSEFQTGLQNLTQNTGATTGSDQSTTQAASATATTGNTAADLTQKLLQDFISMCRTTRISKARTRRASKVCKPMPEATGVPPSNPADIFAGLKNQRGGLSRPSACKFPEVPALIFGVLHQPLVQLEIGPGGGAPGKVLSHGVAA